MPLSKVNLGKINTDVKSKSKRAISRDRSVLRVNKVEGKTSFYSRFGPVSKAKKGVIPSREVLHLSKEAKIISKKYPEFSASLEKWLGNPKIEGLFKFKNKNLDVSSKIYHPKQGTNHHIIFKLNVNFIKDSISKEYFVKFVDTKNIIAPPEFIAGKVFEKFGINTIKPQMAYFKPPNRNVIIYDFTYLETLAQAKEKKIITAVEESLILNKLMSLRDYTNELGLKTLFKPGITDFLTPGNIFVKKENDNIKIYFTDLMVV